VTRIVAGLSAPFPQTGVNRSRAQLITDILDYAGGLEDPDEKAKGGRALDDAIRQFNHVDWQFNVLTSDVTFIANTTDYPLNTFVPAASDFKSPLRMMILDDNNRTVTRLQWVPYPEWLNIDPSQRTLVSMPRLYTIRNPHEAGTVTFAPPLGPVFTYPKARLHYHRRIVRPSGDEAVLNVPEEVENALVQEAVAILLAKTRDFERTESARLIAREGRRQCQLAWRSFKDY